MVQKTFDRHSRELIRPPWVDDIKSIEPVNLTWQRAVVYGALDAKFRKTPPKNPFSHAYETAKSKFGADIHGGPMAHFAQEAVSDVLQSEGKLSIYYARWARTIWATATGNNGDGEKALAAITKFTPEGLENDASILFVRARAVRGEDPIRREDTFQQSLRQLLGIKDEVPELIPTPLEITHKPPKQDPEGRIE